MQRLKTCTPSHMETGLVPSCPLTRVRLREAKLKARDRLVFGVPVKRFPFAPGGELVCFVPGQVFGFVRWRGDGYGTQTWRIVVCEAADTGTEMTKIPGVEPAAALLLHAFGKTRVVRALNMIDGLKKQNELPDIAPEYWRHLHLCIEQNIEPDAYDANGFKALRMAQELRSGL